MGRHEDIKQLCVRILNYYYIFPDTEFTLDTNERVDVVGYFKNRKDPDIGIEIERTSDLQHDALKLAKTSSFQLRFVISENYDTSSLGPVINISGKDVYVVKPPDKDTSFEKRIREYTGQNNKTWFNEFMKQHEIKYDDNSLPDFVNEIKDQGLDVDIAKDIIFRTALGGIRFGYYDQGIRETEYHAITDIPKEALYLSSRGLIYEDRLGRNYETGRQSIYHLSKDGYNLADLIIEERVNKGEEMLQQISEKYGESKVLISLVGTMGEFIDGNKHTDPFSFIPLDLSDPSYSMDKAEKAKILEQKFNIDITISYTAIILTCSPLFLETLRQVYKALIDAQLGNKTAGFTSRGDYFGEVYYVPVISLLKKLNVEKWVNSPQINKLKLYAEWAILRAHNPIVPNTLYGSFKAIGSDDYNAGVLINELAQQGITSKPIKGGTSTMTIYDKKRFNDYCEERMADILKDILEDN